MALGIPAVMVREEDGSYIYEDSFVMMHFMVATAIATAGLHISDTNKMYPIFVRVTRSGQILEEKLRKSIDEIDRYIVFQKYDKIKYLCIIILHPQNKDRNIVIYPEQLNNKFDTININENIEKINDNSNDHDELDEYNDVDSYFPINESTVNHNTEG